MWNAVNKVDTRAPGVPARRWLDAAATGARCCTMYVYVYHIRATNRDTLATPLLHKSMS